MAGDARYLEVPYLLARVYAQEPAARPEELVRLYAAIEAFAKSLGPVEIVARERYVLLRSVRIFSDLVIMSDALRIAIHLARRVDHPLFFKVVADEKKVTHVAKLRTESEWRAVRDFVKEAYEASVAPRATKSE
jgi:hypothetical protein